MDRDYWSALAPDFERRVLQIASADQDGTLDAIASIAGGRDKIAIDFGCGIGSSTRMLAPYFARTIGIDFSPELIERARQLEIKNGMEFRCRDLSRPKRLSPKADVAFAVNVLIQADPAIRRQILNNIVRNTHRQGSVIIVVPSFESLLHVYHCLMRSAGGNVTRKAIENMDELVDAEVESLAGGIVRVGDQPTKLYTRDELELTAIANRLEPISIEKVRYPWSEETDDADMMETFAPPWDWVMVARKT